MRDAVKDHLVTLRDVAKYADIFFSDEIPVKGDEAKVTLASKESRKVLETFLGKVRACKDIDVESFKGIVREVGKETGLKGAKIYHPIRVAITGELNGPELQLIIPVLSRESCVKRIERALQTAD